MCTKEFHNFIYQKTTSFYKATTTSYTYLHTMDTLGGMLWRSRAPRLLKFLQQ